ncbi:MAG: ABC transporter ATP-binding protein [Oscillospiraceae bacterium]|nr:ABC transporter ATP-binding protein [Oscillospiraceae bacterium]
MEAVLQIQGLNKYFGRKKVVDNLNLELYRGEVFGFLGPNGAGKTTTIKMVMSLLQRDGGKVIINGFDIDKQFEKAMACVGGIVENPETYHYMTGLQNLRQYARMRSGVTEERIREVIRFVGLENRINEKVKKYSLGMKQRLGVAQSIMHHPDLLILDEPTNGLDPSGIKELRDLLKRLAHEENICVMVSSHLLSEMQLMCDRVGIISNGSLVDIKNISDLTSETQGQRQFHIAVKGSAANAMALIDDRPTALEDDRHFSVTVDSEDEISDIITLLAVNQVKLITVTEAARNLEEVFIELTGTEGGHQIG